MTKQAVQHELLDILTFHTAEPRELSLVGHLNAIAPTGSSKTPTGAQMKFTMDTSAFLVAAGAAGESEGVYLQEAKGYRFGALPMRKE